MKIETKYNIGQNVYFMSENKVQCKEILSISIEVFPLCIAYGTTRAEIRYELAFTGSMGGNILKYESELFATKEELLASL